MKPVRSIARGALAALIAITLQSNTWALSIIFDYTYDSGGFFTTERRQIVEMAAASFSALVIDRGALTPGGLNQWTWNFSNPSDDEDTVEIPNPVIGAGQLRVFMGAQELDGPTLGFGGNVAYSAFGTIEWLDAIAATNTSAAYKPFGGVITLNSLTDWYDGASPDVPTGLFDLYSVIAHELGHVLGIGLSVVDAWMANIDTEDSLFIGPLASSVFGGPIPLEPDEWHFAQGTEYMGDEFIMVPGIAPGTRKHWTAPELAALRDMGYVLIPEPSAAALFAFGFLCFAALNRFRRHRKI